MSRSIGNSIADSLELCLGYAERLLKGVEPSQYARFATPGSQVIESNHPAFIIGHLTLYAPQIIEALGRTDLTEPVPKAFVTVFDRSQQCQDDPEGTIYPPMGEVNAAFFTRYRNAVTALREAVDDTFHQPNPAEGKMAEMFPTLGSLHAFYSGGHIMMHLGQLSAWRRMMGLGAA